MWWPSLQMPWLADQVLNDTRAAVSGQQDAASEVSRQQRQLNPAQVQSQLLKQLGVRQGQLAALESIARTVSLWQDPRLRLRDPEWNC